MIFVSLALLSLAACVTDFTPEVKGVSGTSEPERWDHGRYPFRRYDHER